MISWTLLLGLGVGVVLGLLLVVIILVAIHDAIDGEATELERQQADRRG